jgi:hypothetical protein
MNPIPIRFVVLLLERCMLTELCFFSLQSSDLQAEVEKQL